jgi:hypothetical protein
MELEMENNTDNDNDNDNDELFSSSRDIVDISEIFWSFVNYFQHMEIEDIQRQEEYKIMDSITKNNSLMYIRIDTLFIERSAISEEFMEEHYYPETDSLIFDNFSSLFYTLRQLYTSCGAEIMYYVIDTAITRMDLHVTDNNLTNIEDMMKNNFDIV